MNLPQYADAFGRRVDSGQTRKSRSARVTSLTPQGPDVGPRARHVRFGVNRVVLTVCR
jgi:hypothetical protein